MNNCICMSKMLCRNVLWCSILYKYCQQWNRRNRFSFTYCSIKEGTFQNTGIKLLNYVRKFQYHVYHQVWYIIVTFLSLVSSESGDYCFSSQCVVYSRGANTIYSNTYIPKIYLCGTDFACSHVNEVSPYPITLLLSPKWDVKVTACILFLANAVILPMGIIYSYWVMSYWYFITN